MTQSSDQPAAIGVDIGGSRCRAASVGADGGILAAAHASTPVFGDPLELARTVAELVARVRADTRTSQRAESTGAFALGIALPGIWDRATTVMERAVNLPALEQIRLRELFESALGRPVQLETDVIAAGYAQWRRCAEPPDRFVYLSIGTGVGACVLLGGQILRHTRGGAGQLGHLTVDTSPNAPLCRCGARGCLEAILGGGLSGSWHRNVTSGHPQELVGRTDPVARALALALLQIAHIYAPNCISLGGGLIDHNVELLEPTRAAFAEIESSLVPDGMRIEQAPYTTDDAGVIGAALLAAAGI